MMKMEKEREKYETKGKKRREGERKNGREGVRYMIKSLKERRKTCKKKGEELSERRIKRRDNF